MISEKEALGKILDAVGASPARPVPISDSLDLFAAEDLSAKLAMPLFDNSAMDGYAVVAPAEKKLRVIGEQPAGLDKQLRVSTGEAVRIFTGAPIPAGANAVVMQEDVTRDGDEITVNDQVDSGDFIRRRGCDLAIGQKILSAGERITPAIAALLAAQGVTNIEISGEVTAAVLSTGDELAKAGDKLEAGQIYESNSVLLDALVRKTGATVKSVEHCRDDFDSLCEAIRRGATADVLIISGGVSVGEHDLVRRALESLGAKIEIWRVAIKPGKPFLFAQLRSPSPQSSPSGRGGSREPRECIVFGLPGNPVSAYVTYFRFVRPAILKMMGASAVNLDPQKFPARLAVDVANDDATRPHYVRGKIESGSFTPVGRQESHALFGLSQSNAVTCVPAGSRLKAGSAIEIEIWE